MSEYNVFLSMKEDLSKAFNSIGNALNVFNKKEEEAKRKSADLNKTLDAEKNNLAK